MAVDSPEVLEAMQELIGLMTSIYSWLQRLGIWAKSLLSVAIAILLLIGLVKLIKVFI